MLHCLSNHGVPVQPLTVCCSFLPHFCSSVATFSGQRLCYAYLDRVRHPNLRLMRVPVFFKLCRLEGISFDLNTQVSLTPHELLHACTITTDRFDFTFCTVSSIFTARASPTSYTGPIHTLLTFTQVGIIFNLVDSPACGTVGMLSTGQSRQAALDKALEALKFIRRIVSCTLLSARFGLGSVWDALHHIAVAIALVATVVMSVPCGARQHHEWPGERDMFFFMLCVHLARRIHAPDTQGALPLKGTHF